MNRILFYQHEIESWQGIESHANRDHTTNNIYCTIPIKDFRALHIITTLQGKVGDSFKCGLINSTLATLQIIAYTTMGIEVCIIQESIDARSLEGNHANSYHVYSVIAHVRPPVMTRILKDLTSMGVSAIYVYSAKLSEKSYMQSSLWQKKDNIVLEGAMQGGAYTIPFIDRSYSLKEALQKVAMHTRDSVIPCSTHEGSVLKITCDATGTHNFYSCVQQFIDAKTSSILKNHNKSIISVIGPERGFTEDEYNTLLEYNYIPTVLSNRILRSETAVTLANGYITGYKPL